MEWNKVVLTYSQIENDGILSRLKEQFLVVFMKTKDTTDMAILSDNDYTDNKIAIYFSPACSPACEVMLRFYGGIPCESPSRDHSFVLAGDDEVVESLR